MKTRTIFLWSILFTLALLLPACASATATSTSTSASLSPVTRLAVGTLKLEGTDQAITSAQAAQLITLWQAYQSLSASDTTAQAELNALVVQIKGVMTAQQIAAIDKMEITASTVQKVMQANMPSITSSSSSSSSTTSSQVAAGGGPGAPMDAGSVPGGDSGISMSDPTLGGAAQSTPQAVSQSQSSNSATQANPMVLKALINLLQSKSQAAG